MLRRQLLTMILLVVLVVAASYAAVAVDSARIVTILMWTVACVVGVGVHAVGLVDAVVDLDYVRRAHLSETHEDMAVSQVRTQTARMLAKAMLAGMGVAVVVIPESDTLRVITTASLLCAVSLLTLESLLDRLTRRRIDARVTEGEPPCRT